MRYTAYAALALVMVLTTVTSGRTLAQETITYGDTVAGSINAEDATVQYQFEGSAGDIVAISMKNTRAEDNWLNPYLTLLDADGNVLEFNDSGGGAYGDALLVAQLPADGVYTIVAQSSQTLLPSTGAYTLSLDYGTPAMLDALPSPLPPDGKIAYGDTFLSDIETGGVPVNAYFDGEEGDTVSILMAEYDASNIDPFLRLLDPDGNELANDDDSGVTRVGAGNDALIVTRLPATGAYTIVCTTPYAELNATGRFTLSLYMDTGLLPGVPVVVNDLAWDSQVSYSIDGGLGNTVTIAVVPLGDHLNPQVGVYDSDDDALIATAMGPAALDFTVRLPDDGVYVLKVSNDGFEAGDVEITLVSQKQVEEAEALAPAVVIQADAKPKIPCTVSTGGAVNMRSGPGTNFDVPGQLTAGQSVRVEGQITGADGYVWWRLANGAWVRSDVVDEAGDCESVPVVEAP